MDIETADGHPPRSHPPDAVAPPVSDPAPKKGGRGARSRSRKRPPPEPKKPGRLARQRQLRRQWNPSPPSCATVALALSAPPAEAPPEAPETPQREVSVDLPGPDVGALAADDGSDATVAAADATLSEEPQTPIIDGPAACDALAKDDPASTSNTTPVPSGRTGRDGETPPAESIPAPARWNRRPALAASVIVAVVGVGLALGRRGEPALPLVATEAGPAAMSAQPDAVGHGPRAWSDLPRPTGIEPAATVAAVTMASRMEPSAIAAVDARPAEVLAGLGPESASRLVAPPLTQDAPQPPSARTSPPHSTETVVPALAGLVLPKEAPTIDPGGVRAATVAVPLPPRRPATFQKPKALAAVSPGTLPPSQKPETTEATGPEDYAAFAARRHEPGLYRIRWGVARLRESANDENARGPSWDFPADQ